MEFQAYHDIDTITSGNGLEAGFYLCCVGKLKKLQCSSIKSMVKWWCQCTFEIVKLPYKTDLPLLIILYMTNYNGSSEGVVLPQHPSRYAPPIYTL